MHMFRDRFASDEESDDLQNGWKMQLVGHNDNVFDP